jgi:hypothetical protein
VANEADVLLTIRAKDRGAVKELKALEKAAGEVAGGFQRAQKASRDFEAKTGAGAARGAAAAQKRAAAEAKAAAAQERAAQRAATAASRQEQAAARAATAQAQKRAADARAAAAEARAAATTDRLAAAQRRQAGASAQAGRANSQAARDTSELGNRAQRTGEQVNVLGRRLLGLVASLAGGFTLARFIGTGFDLSSAIEDAELGIASLVSAQAKVTDETGRTLEGAEALATTYGAARRQVELLRVAGLQTAATTEQLVRAFQTAVGAGVSAGLTLDQIRQFTVRATQAAAALNVPMVQLDQEVRSVLEGTIDYNSRVARALRITNEQVKAAREQGRLAEFLVEKFDQFALAGERASRNLTGVKSNLFEAVQVLAAQATRPLFDSVKQVSQELVESLVDLDTASLAAPFQGFVEGAQVAFRGLASILEGMLRGAVAGAAALGEWFQTHREQVISVASAFGDVLDSIGHVVRTVVGLAVRIVRIGVETGIFAGALRTASQVINAILVTTRALFPIAVALGAVYAANAAFAALAFAPFTVIGATLAGVAIAVNALAARQEALKRQQAQTLQQAPELVRRYRALAGELTKLDPKTEEAKKKEAELKDVRDSLIKLSPDFRKALEDETKSYEELAAAAERTLDVEKERARVKLQEARTELAKAEAELEERRSRGVINISEAGLAALSALERQAARAKREIQELEKLFPSESGIPALPPVLAGPPAKPGKVEPSGGTGGGADADLEQQTQAAIAAIKSTLAIQSGELKRALDRNQLSYAEFFDRLTALQVGAIDAEQTALERLLSSTTDKGKRAKIEQQIGELVAQRRAVLETNIDELVQAIEKMDERVASAEVELLRARGQEVEATKLEVSRAFDEIIAELEANGRIGAVRIFRALADARVAKAEFDATARKLGELQSSVSIAADEVQTRQQIGLISERQARRELVELYERQRVGLASILIELQRTAGADPTPEMRDRIQEVAASIGQLDLRIREQRDSLLRLKGELRDTFESGLSQFLGSTISQVDSLGAALVSFAQSVVQSVQQIVGTIIAQQITDLLFTSQAATAPLITAGVQLGTSAAALTASGAALTGSGATLTSSGGALLASGGALTASGSILLSAAAALTAAAAALAAANAAGVPGFARGGYITGPGTGTSDSIVARLSHGEFVVNARATARHLPLLQAINASAVRTPVRSPSSYGFANGGLVEAVGRRGGAMNGSFTATVGVEDGLVVRHLETPAGERAVIRILERNPSLVRAVLGR